MQHYKMGPRMSQAVVYNGAVHIAGQVADNRKTGIEDQTREVLAKIDSLLAEAGTSRSKLVAVNVFLPHARLADPDLRVEMTAIAAL
jgi:enamine deaminase RidA (YjgF/YER057c/UK114 family)